MVLSSDGLGLPPPWITPAAGLPNREVPPVIIVQRRRLLYPAYVQDYLDRVTAADVAAGDSSGLELGVTDAVSVFMQDLVSISLLGVSANVISQSASVIKAMPIMAGARTRAGARVPVVGPTPTEFGTAGGWNYNRKTGLQGNGTDNYLLANYTYASTLRNNCHAAAWESGSTTTGHYFGAGDGSASGTFIACLNKQSRHYNASTSTFSPATFGTTGFQGVSRSSASSYSYQSAVGGTQTASIASAAITLPSFAVFARNRTTGQDSFTNARIAFYSFGESLTLSLLDTRVATLISAFAAAIP
jgi:hypothetical protein